MNSRLDLDAILRGCMDEPHVYFQPPPNVRMKYPAIVYERSSIDKNNAENDVYTMSHEYKITVIDSNPESPIVDRIAKLPQCRYGTFFISDNLNHDIFYIYY